MIVRIEAKDKRQLIENINHVLDVTTTIVRGSIPTVYDMNNAERTGEHWTRQDDTFEIYQITNNYKFFVRGESDTHISLEFYYRYDMDSRKKTAVSNLLDEFFHYVEIVI